MFGSLCTEDLRPERYNPNNIITFEGTGDPSLCREKVASLFNFSACHDHEACSFDGVYQPRVKGSFVVRAKQQRFLFPLLIISHLPVFPLLRCFPLSYSLPWNLHYLAFWEMISFCTTSLQAFAGFYYTANAFNLSGSFSLHAFNLSTWNFCSKNWNQVSI